MLRNPVDSEQGVHARLELVELWAEDVLLLFRPRSLLQLQVNVLLNNPLGEFEVDDLHGASVEAQSDVSGPPGLRTQLQDEKVAPEAQLVRVSAPEQLNFRLDGLEPVDGVLRVVV